MKATKLTVCTTLKNSAFGFRLLHDRRFKRCHNGLIGRGLVLMSVKLLVMSVRTSSNTFFKPFCVSAEHSTYLTAPSSLASFSPCSLVTGLCFCLASFSNTCESSRKSICVPTIRHGTPGQWCRTSGNHFSLTFSNDAGDVTLKQTRNTSVCGYDSGRSRS